MDPAILQKYVQEKKIQKMMILQKYILKRFFFILTFSLVGVLLFFILSHLVENMDRFIDKQVPLKVVLMYYVYFIPYNLILVLPVATLLSTFFSLGVFAKNNEIVAMKALGYSLYQIATTLLITGFLISAASFVISEGIVVKANQRKEGIDQDYLHKSSKIKEARISRLVIQEPPNQIVSIGLYDAGKKEGKHVKIETFGENRLICRLDAPSITWNGKSWTIAHGIERFFDEEPEKAIPLDSTRTFQFRFTPDDILLTQEKPEEMGVVELKRFIDLVRSSGGEVQQWLTDYYLRFSFPLSNLIIILFSIPLAYNQRKNLAIGFFISLGVCFFYFGLVKMGQTMGEKGSMNPMIAAWLGNGVLIIGGIINLVKARK